MSNPKSHIEKVKEFTSESGFYCPDHPEKMTVEDVDFLAKMILDELIELYATVENTHISKDKLVRFVNSAKELEQLPEEEVLTEQADALVDIEYYLLNSACKRGFNTDKPFDEIHDSNMRKKDPTTGTFLRRLEDGKILKPINWIPPNVKSVVEKMLKYGSWT